MALDKDTLVKHHFWILAGTAGVLALLAWVILLLSGPASAGNNRKANNTGGVVPVCAPTVAITIQ